LDDADPLVRDRGAPPQRTARIFGDAIQGRLNVVWRCPTFALGEDGTAVRSERIRLENQLDREAAMADDDAGAETFRDRLTRQGEDALGRLAQDLLENPLVTGAITRAFDAREKAVSAQETAMSALNLPSAADLERLTRRLRSVSQRLEGIEDGVDRLDRNLQEASRVVLAPDDRLAAIEAQLSKLAGEVAHLASSLDAGPAPLPREQGRLEDDRPALSTIPPARSARKPAAAAPARKRTPRAAKG